MIDDILPVLETYYRDHELAGTWAGFHKSNSSQFTSPTAALATSTPGMAEVLALVSQLGLSPRSSQTSGDDDFCFNCGAKDHQKKDCPKPFPNPDRPQWLIEKCAKFSRGRSTSRGRHGDRNQSRGRSISRSRDSSKRQQTPGRARASSRSEERKSVSFGKTASALNVICPDGDSTTDASQSNSYKAALILSKLQEQMGKE